MLLRNKVRRQPSPGIPVDVLIAEVIEADRDPHVGNLEHHFALMLEYERESRALQNAIVRYTRGLKARFRRMHPYADEKSIKAMAFADPIRKGLIGDQQWYERMAERESAIHDTLLRRRRFAIEHGDISARALPREEVPLPHAA